MGFNAQNTASCDDFAVSKSGRNLPEDRAIGGAMCHAPRMSSQTEKCFRWNFLPRECSVPANETKHFHIQPGSNYCRIGFHVGEPGAGNRLAAMARAGAERNLAGKRPAERMAEGRAEVDLAD